MEGYLIFFALLFVFWFMMAKSKGNPDFWKLTRKYPEIAWSFFTTHPAWHLYEKPLNVKVTGPFHIKNPVTGDIIKIYCEDIYLESSQRDFTNMINNKNN